MINYLTSMDGNILIFIQEHLRSPIVTPIFRFITSLGNKGAIWIILSIALLCFKKTRKTGILAIIALFLSLLIDNILLKNIVARTRPYEIVNGLHILINKPSDYSFPSGHTGSSFAAAIIFYKELPKKYGILALMLAILIGISRLYVGVHYPTDVLGGAMIGTFIALFVYRMQFNLKVNDRKSLEI
ncbi:phosphatase PAP2 family protein [Anaeromicropila herbilytica]|uniref:Phosphatase PAP2 family protein n=1 Tax=Anaeromicropila herbilytica TaxID=2785025 RepID=A0A7R7ELW6_9FIRM|nr:phosphatase PAP2 family protein [Anaeromicropila herbilytica]BCN31169.1 phosphatase PAP2 family protein [Anaeromicropila herbilytica]